LDSYYVIIIIMIVNLSRGKLKKIHTPRQLLHKSLSTPGTI